MSAARDSIPQFQEDRDQARRLGDPWADLCVVASLEDGLARLRVLVLRDLQDGLGVFYNAHSPKAGQLNKHPRSEILSYLDSIKVQYRLCVEFRPLPREIIETHWPRRPEVSKQLDWLYERIPQGSVIDSGSSLASLLKDTHAKDTPPPGASGALLEILSLERLHLKPDGAHQRELFEMASGTRSLLVP